MAAFIKGNAVPNALEYALYKKVGDDYESIASQQIGKITEFELGGIDSSGQPVDDFDRYRTSFIHVDQLVDDPSDRRCINIGGFQGYTQPLAIFYSSNDYSSFKTYLTFESLSDFVGKAENIKEYAKSQGAKFVIFCIANNVVSPYVNLTNEIFFSLDVYEDVLTVERPYQLVVKAIGEGGVDLNGDKIIYEDSENSNEILIQDFTYCPEQKIITGVYIDSSTLQTVEHASFNVAKVRVTPGTDLSVSARLGTAVAACWVDKDGNRTLCVSGNGNEGLNVIETFTVPDNAVYLECSYAKHLPCTISVMKPFAVGSAPTPTNTVVGKYVNKDGTESDLAAMNYESYSVSKGQYYRIRNRNGASSAAVAWVTESGWQVAVVGNSDDGVNVDVCIKVPAGVTSMLVSYVSSQEHSVTRLVEV